MAFVDNLTNAMRSSPFGESLLHAAVDAGYSINSATDRNDAYLRSTKAFGYCNHDDEKIVVNERYGAAVGLCSLAHECEHARQKAQGETRTPGRPDYVEVSLQNERSAESAANALAYDRYLQGDWTARESQESNENPWSSQAQSYGSLRDLGFSHGDACTASEPLWDRSLQSNGYRIKLERDVMAYERKMGELLPPDTHLSSEKAIPDNPQLSASRAEIMKRFEKSAVPVAPSKPAESQSHGFSM